MNPKLAELFRSVFGAACAELEIGQQLELVNCPEVKRSAPDKRRAYAHVGHQPGKVCVDAKGFERLPIEHKVGILLHELGHVGCGDDPSELAADAWVFERLGIAILYRGPKRLQWVAKRDFKRLVE